LDFLVSRPPFAFKKTHRILISSTVIGLALLIIFTSPGITQSNDPDHPGNKIMGEFGRGSATRDCVVHHRGEGMRDAFILVPLLPKQLKIGEEAQGYVQVINPWKQNVAGMSMNVSMVGNAEGQPPMVVVPGASAGTVSGPQNEELNFERSFVYRAPPLGEGSGGTLRINFTTKAGAEVIAAQVFLDFADTLPNGNGGVDVKLRAEQELGKDLEPKDGRAPVKSIVRNDSVVRNNQKWALTFNWDIHPHQHGDTVNIRAKINVIYAGAGGDKQTFNIKGIDPTIDLAPGKSTVLSFPLLGLAEGTQHVEIAVRGMTYFADRHDDRSTPDFDNYTRYWTVPVAVGTTFMPAEGQVVEDKAPEDDARFVVAEVSGFSAGLLLVPSLFLGGTFGKGSRKFFNTILGGAKRRVMYHSLLSLGITLTAVVHIILFFLEVRYSLKMGMVWGGLGALSLLVLGLTGYYQVPFIQRHGYKGWRYTHLTVGVLVVMFVAIHAIMDGPDFIFLKEGQAWLDSLNMTNK
jgi:hypothetical protein